MKKKFLALSLAAVLALSMSFTAFAASSSTTSNSSSSSSDDEDDSSSSSSSSTTTTSTASTEVTVEEAAAGEEVTASTVTVAVASADGTVAAVTLDTVIEDTVSTVVAAAATAAATAAPEQLVVTVEALMTTAPTEFFTQTVAAVAQTRGSAMVVNNMGTIKTAATATDAFGNVIASAGTITGVTDGSLVLLMSVNADGTIEYVEGVVDPVTGQILGAFKGVPTVITVLVLA